MFAWFYPTSNRRLAVFMLAGLVLLQAMGLGLFWLGAWTHARALSNQHKTPPVLELHRLSVRDFQANRVGARELRLNHRLYDIRGMEMRGDSVRLWLEADKREAQLIQILESTFSNVQDPAKPFAATVHWLKIWQSTFYLKPAVARWAIQELVVCQSLPGSMDHCLPSLVLDVPDLPPWT